ncbi:intermediate cleaving peptidase 55, mitochondrial-like [Silene latifolia]|uniref:intermediate cleaving peptidase 55, mitochondrial-like n=1 Tax=Silene latifolia TaxID=37657 RepID=UPI003D778467
MISCSPSTASVTVTVSIGLEGSSSSLFWVTSVLEVDATVVGSVASREESKSERCYVFPRAELYELILETNKECIELCKPGVSISNIHEYSVHKLHKGLTKFGILKNKASSYRLYHQLNPTNIGHYLGMDVHDCSTISNDRPLKPGVVITIEPGIYIPSSFDGPER